MEYLAVVDGEVWFTIEASKRSTAELMAEFTVIIDMHDCHYWPWQKRGRMLTEDEYRDLYPPTNEAAVRY